MRAYGAIPGYLGDEGVSPPPQEDPLVQQTDIHELKRKYVGEGSFENGGTEDIRTFNLTAGQAIKFDNPSLVTNGFIINCSAGTAKVYLGDYTANPGAAEHITVPSGGSASQYMLSTKAGRIITVACDPAAANPAVGCLVVLRV